MGVHDIACGGVFPSCSEQTRVWWKDSSRNEDADNGNRRESFLKESLRSLEMGTSSKNVVKHTYARGCRIRKRFVNFIVVEDFYNGGSVITAKVRRCRALLLEDQFSNIGIEAAHHGLNNSRHSIIVKRITLAG